MVVFLVVIRILPSPSYHIVIIHFINLLEKKYLGKIFDTFLDLFHKNPHLAGDFALKAQYVFIAISYQLIN